MGNSTEEITIKDEPIIWADATVKQEDDLSANLKDLKSEEQSNDIEQTGIKNKSVDNAENYSCSLCQFKTDRKKSLRRHSWAHVCTDQFYCGTCGYKTNRKYTLMIHMRTHSTIQEFRCDLCNFATKWKHSLVTHSRAHESGGIKTNTYTQEDQERIKQRNRINSKSYRARLKFKKQLEKSQISSASTSTQKDREIIIKQTRKCSKRHRERLTLEKQRLEHDNLLIDQDPQKPSHISPASISDADNSVRYTQEYFEKIKQVNQERSKRHQNGLKLRKHGLELDDLLFGQGPQKTSYNSPASVTSAHKLGSDMENSTEEIWIKEEPIIWDDAAAEVKQEDDLCANFDVHFTQQRCLTAHLEKHKSVEELRCYLCNFVSFEQDKLREHARQHVKDNTMVQCEICNGVYKKVYIKQHLKRHTNEKRYPCQLCEYRSMEKWDLKRHMKLHDAN